ncbi:MAG: haloacid dehalogenase-like hydrolase [Thermoplasmata archaeon]
MLVTFDIDGTLTIGHGWARVAEAFGRTEEYRETESRFRAGEIGEDEHLGNLLSLARGRTLQELEAVLGSTPKVRGIRPLLAHLKSLGFRVALLTHNPPYVCRWYARRFGFEDFEGAPGPDPVAGVLPASPPVRADKIGQVRRLARRIGADLPRTIHVGDSASDALVFRVVGAGVAFRAGDPEVRARADAAVDGAEARRLAPVIARLARHIDRRT